VVCGSFTGFDDKASAEHRARPYDLGFPIAGRQVFARWPLLEEETSRSSAQAAHWDSRQYQPAPRPHRRTRCSIRSALRTRGISWQRTHC
jgi:hypothetical protein